MTLLKWRVFNMALLLAFAVMMPGAISAQTQMSEIQLGSGGGGGGGGAQSMSGGALLDGAINYVGMSDRPAEI
jgi:hypothetical protein